MEPHADDEGFLDLLLDRAVAGLAEGTPLDAAPLLAERPQLAERILAALALAEAIAVQRPAALPEVEGYEIVRELGRGSMGTVWLARQVALAGRLVALKILPAPFSASPRARARFFEEVRALARVRHQGVVAAYDVVGTGGVLAYAMQWVEGRTWGEACAHLVSLGARASVGELAAFLGAERLGDASLVRFHARVALAVARALDAVHAERILHRDVKPSNVLLGADGAVLLSDFGLARAAEETLGTRTGDFLGTPAYAAPEQLEGRWSEVGERTDVYGLGAALYHALAGAPPFPGRTPSEILARVREAFVEPLRKLVPGLPRDLAIVVMKAIEPEPSRRYARASALADDLERFQAGRPILARAPSAAYRFGRLVLRHKAPFALLALLFLALAAFGATMAVTSQRLGAQAAEIADKAERLEREGDRARSAESLATAEAQRARLAAQRAERFTALFLDTFSSVNTQAGGADLLVRDVLAGALERAEQELAGEPEIRASVLATLGESYAALGLYAQAEPLLERALAAFRELGPDEQESLRTVAGSLAHCLVERDELERAEPLLVEALAIALRLHGEESGEHADALNELAVWREARGELAQAEELLRRALGIYAALGGDRRRDEADLANNLAAVLHQRGDDGAAEPLFRRALALHRATLGDEHQSVALERNNLAALLGQRGELDESEALYRDALPVLREKLGPAHPHLAVTLANLARLLHMRGDDAAALPLASEAYDILRAALGEESTDAGLALSSLGAIELALRGPGDALPALERALAILRAELPPEHPELARALEHLAAAERALGELGAARGLLDEALALRTSALGARHPEVARTMFQLAGLAADEGDDAQAARLLEECVAIEEESFQDEPQLCVAAELQLARAQARLGRGEEAAELLRARLARLQAASADLALAALVRAALDELDESVLSPPELSSELPP